MTREEAQIIIGNIPIYGDDCYTISEYQEAKAMAIEALEAQRWVPVSKKLPDIDQPVLTWVSGNYWLAELHSLDGELYWSFDDFDLSGEDFDDVRAWRPLPEPYT